MPNKDDIADTLESIGLLLELKGENAFKTRAYANAARTVETYAGNIEEMAREGRLAEIPGIGEAIAAKIAELVETGRLEFYEKLRAEFPAALFELFELQGVGPKKIKALYEHLGVDEHPRARGRVQRGARGGAGGFRREVGGENAGGDRSAREVRGYVTGSARWRRWRRRCSSICAGTRR